MTNVRVRSSAINACGLGWGLKQYSLAKPLAIKRQSTPENTLDAYWLDERKANEMHGLRCAEMSRTWRGCRHTGAVQRLRMWHVGTPHALWLWFDDINHGDVRQQRPC